ncbi:MAG TPA: 3-deoxy-manno-octulosonate cytidylyltransferase [Methylococcaceae bacterium]|jgi:3-deoxy-manno-octulosonate cytidylyltransferase (CMP-KDO synthetase)|nr:3-deoxy-manno-octulosonate cytidylyltransferase [Methylococcaceae bacterium]
MTPFKTVIPARFGSSRLPGKPLLDIAGKPMIVHVCERALEAGGDVFVATDDTRIVEAVAGLKVKALMTRADHASGTDRITEVAEIEGWSDDTLVVNLQGDEPLMQPSLVRELAEVLAADREASVATLAAPIREAQEVFDPNAVKVVTNREGHALYFSRAPIPWHRDHFRETQNSLPPSSPWLRHIGIYAYRAGFLRRYVRWPQSALEQIEALEQLRILWQGEKIKVMTVAEPPHAGVDTAEDLARVSRMLEG